MSASGNVVKGLQQTEADVAASLRAAQEAEDRKNWDTYRALIQADEPDVKKLHQIAKSLGRTPDEVGRDIDTLRQAAALEDSLAKAEAATSDGDVAAAMRVFDAAHNAVEEAKKRELEAHNNCLAAIERGRRPGELRDQLLGLRNHHPGLFGLPLPPKAEPTPPPSMCGPWPLYR